MLQARAPQKNGQRRCAETLGSILIDGQHSLAGGNVADIQLSSELFQDIQAAVEKQAPGADQAVVMQYLAAVMGYMLGSQRGMSEADRDNFMDELCGFARHVVSDLTQQQQQQQQTSAQAFGYWEPPAKT